MKTWKAAAADFENGRHCKRLGSWQPTLIKNIYHVRKTQMKHTCLAMDVSNYNANDMRAKSTMEKKCVIFTGQKSETFEVR